MSEPSPPISTDDRTCGCEKGSPPFICDEYRDRGDGVCKSCEHLERCHPDRDHVIVVEARQYADRVFRDAPNSHEAYMMGVRFAVEKLTAEIERLRALVPTGDYVLTDDMSEENSRRWGKGLFCGFDDIKSVES